MQPTAINAFYLGWTMVFKAVGGVEKNVYEVYKSDQTSSEDKVEALDVTNKYRDHYKNRIVLFWEIFDASEVLSNKYYNHPSQTETTSMLRQFEITWNKAPYISPSHSLDTSAIYTRVPMR